MTEFIERLEEWASKDTKVRAVLRRSLAFAPGQFPPAYPYVEPFLQQKEPDENTWRRKMYYLIAGLWATYGKRDRLQTSETKSIAIACAEYVPSSKSVERRFIAVIDADDDQLPHRLRYLVALLKSELIDFAALLIDVLNWRSGQKRTQNKWARDFYRALDSKNQTSKLSENI